MKIIQEGETGTALAPGRGRVPIVFEYRDLTLDSGVVARDVMVGVAADTGEVLTVPAQSAPRLKAARERGKDETFSVRIPPELSDVLWGVSEELGASPAKLNPALVRYYLHEATESPALARRLKRLSRHPLASRSPRTKLTVRSTSVLLDRVKALENKHDVTRSDLVRGAILATMEDVFDRPAKDRLGELKAIAEAV
jgi:predicted DNA-binding protein